MRSAWVWGSVFINCIERVAQKVAHGCLNGLGQWFVAGLGGIRRAAGHAGFQRFQVRPAIGIGGLRSAAVSFDSPFGLIRSAWAVDGSGSGQLNVTVPPNTRASIYVPSTNRSAAAYAYVLQGNQTVVPVVHDVGSGSYAFSW